MAVLSAVPGRGSRCEFTQPHDSQQCAPSLPRARAPKASSKFAPGLGPFLSCRRKAFSARLVKCSPWERKIRASVYSDQPIALQCRIFGPSVVRFNHHVLGKRVDGDVLSEGLAWQGLRALARARRPVGDQELIVRLDDMLGRGGTGEAMAFLRTLMISAAHCLIFLVDNM